MTNWGDESADVGLYMQGKMMGIINPLGHDQVAVERVNDGDATEWYVECSSRTNKLSVLTGPMAPTAEGAVIRWNEEWEGKLK